MNMFDIGWVSLGIALGTFLLCLGIWRYVHRLGTLRQHTQLQLDALQKDVRALCTGGAVQGEHITRLEQQLRRLSARHDQAELRSDTGEQPYTYAIRLAQQGADAAQLVTTCPLTREEAELLVRLHGRKLTKEIA